MDRLTSQDLMALRDAADALSDIDDGLAMDLHGIGDKIADQLKFELDTRQGQLFARTMEESWQ